MQAFEIIELAPGITVHIVAGLHGITRVGFGDAPRGCGVRDPRHSLVAEAVRQLREYAAGNLRQFDLPLEIHGTEFQKRAWEALCRIPYGETRSYAQIAAGIGHPKAVRAVGGANHANPIAIVIPCHRVINAGGGLGGYGGGLDLKRKLLSLERSVLAGKPATLAGDPALFRFSASTGAEA